MVTFSEFINNFFYLCLNNIEDGFYTRYCVCNPINELDDDTLSNDELTISSDSCYTDCEEVEISPPRSLEQTHISGYISSRF